jgi:hypothetical protein
VPELPDPAAVAEQKLVSVPDAERNRASCRIASVKAFKTKTKNHCGAALALCMVGFDTPVLGTFGLRRRFELMRKASKSRRAVIPEPSFKFFIHAMSAMLLLVVIMAAYFSLHVQQM